LVILTTAKTADALKALAENQTRCFDEKRWEKVEMEKYDITFVSHITPR
jgi:hypothetical protein